MRCKQNSLVIVSKKVFIAQKQWAPNGNAAASFEASRPQVSRNMEPVKVHLHECEPGAALTFWDPSSNKALTDLHCQAPALPLDGPSGPCVSLAVQSRCSRTIESSVADVLISHLIREQMRRVMLSFKLWVSMGACLGCAVQWESSGFRILSRNIRNHKKPCICCSHEWLLIAPRSGFLKPAKQSPFRSRFSVGLSRGLKLVLSWCRLLIKDVEFTKG